MFTIRLNKYISESIACSRREADKFIERGCVVVNGKPAKLGDQVGPGDKVMVNGQKLDQIPKNDFLIIALNKPVGITSTTEATVKGNIIDFVNHSQRIFPIGRLDKDSQGLILLTNNGDIVNKILRAGNKHEKEYIVTVNKPITDGFIDGMANGVPILGQLTKKCKVFKESPFIFRVVLTQGMNRQIRRMCEHFKYEVVKLERIRVMNISLKGLPLGDWRELDDEEVSSILKQVEKSRSEQSTGKVAKSTSKRVFKKGESFKETTKEKRFGSRKSGGIDEKNDKRKRFTEQKGKPDFNKRGNAPKRKWGNSDKKK